jgi:protein-arginine kinase activator protein McsA
VNVANARIYKSLATKIFMEQKDEREYKCQKCKDTGKVLSKHGMHVCYDCLQSGRLDVHSKDVKDTNIRW